MANQHTTRINWIQAKLDYINDPTLRYEDIAEKYSTALGTVTAHASREKWVEARQARSELLQRNSIQKNISAATQELAKWNEQDIIVAKTLRSCVMRKLQDAQKAIQGSPEKPLPLEPSEIKSLANAVESAQRIARLALGAATAVVGPPSIDPTMPDMEILNDDELDAVEQGAIALRRLLAKGDSSGGSGKTSSGSTKVQ